MECMQLIKCLVVDPEYYWNVPDKEFATGFVIGVYMRIVKETGDIPNISEISAVVDSHNEVILTELANKDNRGEAGKYSFSDRVNERAERYGMDTNSSKDTVVANEWFKGAFSVSQSKSLRVIRKILDTRGFEYFDKSSSTGESMRVNSSLANNIFWNEEGEQTLHGEVFWYGGV